MSFIDTKDIPVISRRPGWYGRQFDSLNMTFVHYAFDAGASIHRHAHEQEEVWHILEGELDICIGKSGAALVRAQSGSFRRTPSMKSSP